MIFRVRVYSDHALVGKDTYIKPLSKLGARLLEMEEAAAKKPPVEKKAKKTRKKRTAKKAAEPSAEVGDAPEELIGG